MEGGCPPGTSITIRDIFFNTPARKFLKSESTELSHMRRWSRTTRWRIPTSIELHSAEMPALGWCRRWRVTERVYQVFGKDVLDQLISVAAELPLGIPLAAAARRAAKNKKRRIG